MKKELKKVKALYQTQISIAKANQYEAVILSLDGEYDPYCLNNIDDTEYIYDFAADYGWDRFVIIDFINKSEKIIDLDELEAA